MALIAIFHTWTFHQKFNTRQFSRLRFQQEHFPSCGYCMNGTEMREILIFIAKFSVYPTIILKWRKLKHIRSNQRKCVISTRHRQDYMRSLQLTHGKQFTTKMCIATPAPTFRQTMQRIYTANEWSLQSPVDFGWISHKAQSTQHEHVWHTLYAGCWCDVLFFGCMSRCGYAIVCETPEWDHSSVSHA